MMLGIGEFAVKEALKRGADEAEVFLGIERELSVTFERNDVNLGKAHEMSGVGIRVFKNKALGFSSVNSLANGDISKAVENSIKLAKNSPPDKYNELPDKRPIRKVPGIFDKDSGGFRSTDALEHATRMFRSAKDYDERITVDSCTFAASMGERAVVSSRGVGCEERFSTFTYNIIGMARDGEEVSTMDYLFDGNHSAKEIDCEEMARDFAERVVKSLGAKKIESFMGSILLSPMTSVELLGSLLSFSCNSNKVQKGASKFRDKLGKGVASGILTARDDGSLPGGLGSASFDREGLPHSPLPLIEKGTLKAFMYNSYTARKEDRDSTSHAAGGTRDVPSIAPTNLMIEPGREGWMDIVKDIRKGILVNRFSGFPDPISGDFSGVVKGGWLIENGELVKPVIETMIAGNIFELLRKVSAISKERRKLYNFIMPYIRIDDVSVTGG